MRNEGDPELLEKARKVIDVEQKLTEALAMAKPYMDGVGPRPTPKTMEEVHQVLAVARHWSHRTSAPAGWSPSAPVVGFSTPNPLPHQLRGGALAALQLERAQRKRKADEVQKKAQAAKKAEPSKVAPSPTQRPDPKKQEVQDHRAPGPARQARPVKEDAPVVSMNLSDSSSSSDEDDSD